MASLVLSGDTSGTVTLAAPAVAGTQSYTLPTAVPAANGYALTSTTGGTMSWVAQTAPGGSTTQVQYNNAGAFGGISGFTTDGTRVTASTTIGVGGATPSTSGSGITFPATQSASTDANTLDDYEEGSWTPSVSNMTTTGSPAYGGRYRKIGSQVTIWFFTTTASGGVATYATTSNSTNVSGMPFNAAYDGPAASGGPPGIAVNGTTTAGGFLQGPISSATFYFNTTIASSQGISASLTYYTT